MNLKFVLTGGPGGGKTTLLNALTRDGFATVNESARQIIQDRLAAGASPRGTALEFAQVILQKDIANYASVASDIPVIFDRGVVDALCQLQMAGGLTLARRRALLKQYAYHKTVFLLPAWEAIYRQDAERDQTFDDAVAVCERLRSWYQACGYTVVELAPGTVEERLRTVVDHMGAQLAQGTDGI